MVKVYAPASVGNVSVGFDVLGAAVSPVDGSLLGDCVTVEAAPVFSLKTEGSFVSKLPADPQQNIAFHSWKRFCETLGRPIPVTMTLEKNMPVGSGLGSSACSVVAGLVAMNEFCDNPLNPHQLLKLMGELEGQISGSVHYDNVAPCYLGGLQLMLGEQNIISQSVAAFDHWFWVMAYPGIHVSTAEARAILPQYYSKADIIRHGRLLSGFIHACHTQQPELAATMMQDVVAEPYRTQLLPGFAAARAACLKAGALACGISGSGPTLFAICDNEQIAEMVKNRLAEQYLQNDEGFVHICRLDIAGTRKLG